MANLDQSWVNVNVDALMERFLGRTVVALNDADAAGIAEVAYGAAKGRDGVIVFTTQGTGIGSAIIVNGTLLTNTELGHLEIDGTDAEKNASSGPEDPAGPGLGAVGAAPPALLQPRGVPAQPRPVRRGWRRV